MTAPLANADPGDLTAICHRTTMVDGLSIFYREQGLSDLWAPRRAFRANRVAHEAVVRANLLSLVARLNAQPLAWITLRSRG